MRTRETVLGILALTVTLALLPSAFAQNEDPSLNESDMDTNPPPADESYLDDAEQESTGEPTLSESDMDTNPPPSDEGYLDEAEREISSSGDGAEEDDAKGTPGAPLVAVLGAVGVVALLARRR